MKLIKKLKSYSDKEIDGAMFGFGILKAMDYEKGVYGHLILFSVNLKFIRFIKKLFVRI